MNEECTLQLMKANSILGCINKSVTRKSDQGIPLYLPLVKLHLEYSSTFDAPVWEKMMQNWSELSTELWSTTESEARRGWGTGTYLVWRKDNYRAGICSNYLPTSIKKLPKIQIQAVYLDIQQENERVFVNWIRWYGEYLKLFLIIAFHALFE